MPRSRQDEIEAMSGTDQFREFYRRLKRINEYYSEWVDCWKYNYVIIDINDKLNFNKKTSQSIISVMQ